MFPPSLPHVFIRWLTLPGDVVYDPFCGRGTTPLEACLQGRIGVGSDASPLAVALTRPKLRMPSAAVVHRRLDELRRTAREHGSSDVPPQIRMLFNRLVLRRLLWLRSALEPRRAVDDFLRAVLLGGLHANANVDGVPRGLTIAMPNTFAMAPGYVRRYMTRHSLKPPRHDPVEFLTRRAERYLGLPESYVRGHAWQADCSRPIRWRHTIPKPKLIFTSPPYLEVIRYGKFNWIKLWLLGKDPRIVDSALFTSRALDRYLEFSHAYLRSLADVIREDGIVALVIGDVEDRNGRKQLAREVAQRAVPGVGLRVLGTITDRIPTEHKVTRIWKEARGQATRTDRILLLGGPRARLPRPIFNPAWDTDLN